MFWGRPRLRILLEASTESEWVAQHLEMLGHEVIVADPNYAPMYGHRSRRMKTDRRDVAAWRRRVNAAPIARPSTISPAADGASAAEHPAGTEGSAHPGDRLTRALVGRRLWDPVWLQAESFLAGGGPRPPVS